MRFTETKVAGAFLIEPEPIADERGFFARTWCREEFADHGLTPELAQANLSFNHRRGTLRGLHYQAAPHAEAKLVRVTRGAIWDLALDLRRDSPTYLAWFGAELSDANRQMLYVPEGCAHGFLTLTDEAEVAYQMSAPYAPQAARGVRFDDPAFGIEWPGEVVVINERDRTYPDFAP
ncbi:MAG TPA: dTDP-4-dehydrorhamnose 3,5-epimerase [Acidimicrobiales bacterium]|nr:dTDP-4-dehydrorhamnose 3,5-epimerase [Acidimicrobiales bacterium]